MTVGELIAQLQKFDPDHEAVIVHPSVGETLPIGAVWTGDEAGQVEVAVDE